MEKMFYTIGEAAAEIGESVSLVRFWSNSFPSLIRPSRNAKGNRLYSPEDIAALKQIHYLVKEKGMTLEGAAARLASDRISVDRNVKLLESLRQMRARLVEIKKNIS